MREKSPSSFYSCLCLFIAGGSSWEGRNKGSIRPESGFEEGPRWEASAPVSRVLHCSHGPDKTAESPWEQLELWAAGTARTPEPCVSRVRKVEDSKAKQKNAGMQSICVIHWIRIYIMLICVKSTIKKTDYCFWINYYLIGNTFH